MCCMSLVFICEQFMYAQQVGVEPVLIFAGGEAHSFGCNRDDIISDVLPSMFDTCGKWAAELAGHSRAEFFPFSRVP